MLKISERLIMMIAEDDYTYINTFMTLPEIFKYAAEHTVDISEVGISRSSNDIWLSYCYMDEKVGLVNLIKTSSTAMSIHPYILEEHKVLFKDMILCVYRFINSYIHECVKLNATIASKFNRTIEIAKDCGMIVEGRIRDNYRISATRICDSYVLGITKQEMGECYG